MVLILHWIHHHHAENLVGQLLKTPLNSCGAEGTQVGSYAPQTLPLSIREGRLFICYES